MQLHTLLCVLADVCPVSPFYRLSVDWHGLSISLCGHSGNARANYLNTFQLERGRVVSLG